MSACPRTSRATSSPASWARCVPTVRAESVRRDAFEPGAGDHGARLDALVRRADPATGRANGERCVQVLDRPGKLPSADRCSAASGRISVRSPPLIVAGGGAASQRTHGECDSASPRSRAGATAAIAQRRERILSRFRAGARLLPTVVMDATTQFTRVPDQPGKVSEVRPNHLNRRAQMGRLVPSRRTFRRHPLPYESSRSDPFRSPVHR